ncbi:hypothetical protein OBBRIDRAFT_802333 [Obba rivulosa]|uniref:Uncharacterized protein n=1 Tax=Obba rivulosa TaxID=1052685 RepID=A0A8E2B581_9APHY|nr:hypothetical protein OBBRIDRAFT_802333 [Obba rivulosa]
MKHVSRFLEKRRYLKEGSIVASKAGDFRPIRHVAVKEGQVSKYGKMKIKLYVHMFKAMANLEPGRMCHMTTLEVPGWDAACLDVLKRCRWLYQIRSIVDSEERRDCGQRDEANRSEHAVHASCSSRVGDLQMQGKECEQREDQHQIVGCQSQTRHSATAAVSHYKSSHIEQI